MADTKSLISKHDIDNAIEYIVTSAVSNTDGWDLRRRGFRDEARHNDKVKESIKRGLKHLIGEEARLLVETFQFLAVAFGQSRFVVPGIDLARASIDEQPDDRLGFAIEMSHLGSEGIIGGEQAFLCQETGEAQASKAGSGCFQPVTTGGKRVKVRGR